MADLPIIARRQVRQAVLAALNSAGLGIVVTSPGDWNNPPETLPAVQVRTPGDRKEGIMSGPAQFTTVVTVEIDARVAGANDSVAQDAIEALCYQIECAVLTNHDLGVMVSKFSSVESTQSITAEGRRHVGAAQIAFHFELCEMFDPLTMAPAPLQPVAVELESVEVHNDMIGTFDPSGAYTNLPFPDAVTSAPRTRGPDGRDEGALNIDLSQ